MVAPGSVGNNSGKVRATAWAANGLTATQPEALKLEVVLRCRLRSSNRNGGQRNPIPEKHKGPAAPPPARVRARAIT